MWKKKLREYKGRNYKYSLRKKLHREKRTTDDFETMLHNLTLEEVIGLKLELIDFSNVSISVIYFLFVLTSDFFSHDVHENKILYPLCGWFDI